MKRLLFILVSSFLVISCSEEIIIDTDTAEGIYAIDAAITNSPGVNYVAINNVVDFYSEDLSDPVTDATVVLSNENGLLVNFKYDSLTQRYLPDLNNFSVNVVGVEYTLDVEIDSVKYVATDVLTQGANFDLVWELDEDEYEDPSDEGEYYRAKLNIADLPGDNFYLSQQIVNDTLRGGFGFTVISDELLDLNELSYSLPGYYSKNDTMFAIVSELSNEAYIYFQQANSMIQNEGGLFSPIPANPYTNFISENGDVNVVGFFRATGIYSDSTIIGVTPEDNLGQ